VPGGRHVRPEAPLALAALDERLERGQDRLMAAVELGLREARVDLDERVKALGLSINRGFGR
jgi:hypothetical protein